MTDRNLDIETILARARFLHLDEAEVGGWLDDGLDELTHARVAAHLKICLLCESRIRRARGISMVIPLGLVAKGRESRRYEGQSKDGVLRFVASEGPDLTVNVSLSSLDLGLADHTVQMQGGQFSRRVRLVRLAADQVGADTVLNAQDRHRLGGAPLEIAVLPKSTSRRAVRRTSRTPGHD